MDEFNRNWITENAIEVCELYDYGVLTLRGLHYQLVSRGMTNSTLHYKRVVAAIIKARWDRLIEFDQFSDHDRSTIGETNYQYTDVDDAITEGKEQVESWMNFYQKNRWENQNFYVQVWIEKMALMMSGDFGIGFHKTLRARSYIGQVLSIRF